MQRDRENCWWRYHQGLALETPAPVPTPIPVATPSKVTVVTSTTLPEFTAVSLFDTKEANPVRFHRKYGNKTVDVTGEIASFDLWYSGRVDIDLNTHYWDFWGWTPSSLMTCKVGPWNTAFNENVDIGDFINVIGVVEINNSSWIYLEDCRLAE